MEKSFFSGTSELLNDSSCAQGENVRNNCNSDHRSNIFAKYDWIINYFKQYELHYLYLNVAMKH